MRKNFHRQTDQLTVAIRPTWQHRHGARLEQFAVQLLLLQLVQLGVELALVDGLAGLGPAGDRGADLVGQGFLFGEVLPEFGASRLAKAPLPDDNEAVGRHT